MTTPLVRLTILRKALEILSGETDIQQARKRARAYLANDDDLAKKGKQTEAHSQN